ncbi:MAG: tol-pal system protein YbgF [Thiobacillus sp. 65-69]|nr:tol-pal system protein YbgF [Thiobacillus sp.]ODU90000.1 MAG: tol-pal system protein YbgF [Thiobacillus sp. SCN 65-179]OJW39678.1 MAG: tol-pal system protein YbgF [Thiobacillus sp. 65-69]
MPAVCRICLILALAVPLPATAQLFGGNSTELAAQVQALRQKVDALDVRLLKLEGLIQQNQELLGLLKEVETLKADVAKMRGQGEMQAHQIDTLGKRQNDLYVDLDQRLGELAKAAKPAPAPAPPPVAAASQAPAADVPAPSGPPPTPAAQQLDPLVESRTYEAALNHFREANYAGAIAGFKGFLKAYPDSALAPNAQYWIGYSYYALKDYKTALAHQQKLVAAYPGSAKVPDALLNIATNQIALDNLDAAKKTLEDLVSKHPGTNAATLASRRLAALK